MSAAKLKVYVDNEERTLLINQVNEIATISQIIISTSFPFYEVKTLFTLITISMGMYLKAIKAIEFK
ncbi:hypothetical protein GCM10009111_29780 [Colwellia asteriadis]|uniref:Uncharacterized protein n=1 Tax=Colwellia asteriadis TaxID=517723 RepID=A0ABN1LA21_9GAMM